jgi:hypothetical protein
VEPPGLPVPRAGQAARPQAVVAQRPPAARLAGAEGERRQVRVVTVVPERRQAAQRRAAPVEAQWAQVPRPEVPAADRPERSAADRPGLRVADRPERHPAEDRPELQVAAVAEG